MVTLGNESYLSFHAFWSLDKVTGFKALMLVLVPSFLGQEIVIERSCVLIGYSLNSNPISLGILND